jgi:hypothetical protein
MRPEERNIAGSEWIAGIDPGWRSCPQALSWSTPVRLLAENRSPTRSTCSFAILKTWLGMTMEPVPLEGWELGLVGLIKPFRVVIRAENPSRYRSSTMVLQCSGNGRNQYPEVRE